jgi:hypothetical protein
VAIARYEVYLSRRVERRIELDFDIQFKPSDEFRWGPDIYVVTRVEPGHDKFDAVLFAAMIAEKPLP